MINIKSFCNKLCCGPQKKCCICLNEEKLIAFYQRLLVDSDLRDKFESIMKKGGDNHVTNSKLANAVEFINNWAPV